jgi:hypothetical protein
MRVHIIAAVTLAVVNLGVQANKSEALPLCIGPACLGMTLDQLKQLDLKPAHSVSKLQFNHGFDSAAGVDVLGKRITFGGNYFDRSSIEQFQKRVKTICSVGSVMGIWRAETKASDGRDIRMSLAPTIKQGKAEFVVVEIDRYISGSTTAAQTKALEEELRQKYGAHFNADPSASGWDVSARSRVYLATHAHFGPSIKLAMPEDVYLGPVIRDQLLQQPGCTEKQKVD